MFITLEGSEGSGKSTLIDLIKKYFSDKKIDFLFTREPGGTKEGQAIRNILLDKKIELDPYSETFLILADRNEHIDKVIKPALKRNQNIFHAQVTLENIWNCCCKLDIYYRHFSMRSGVPPYFDGCVPLEICSDGNDERNN